MNKMIRKRSFRIISIVLPIIFFLFGFKFLAPLINFELMPADDNNIVNYTIKSAPGTTTEAMNSLVGNIDSYFSGYKEIKNVAIITNGNIMNIAVNLTAKEERKSRNEMSAFDIEKKITTNIKSLESK